MINYNNPPKDRNFIGCVVVFSWSSDIGQHVKVGMKWEECWWYEGNYYGEPCYARWCGKRSIHGGGKAIIEGWIELPRKEK